MTDKQEPAPKKKRTSAERRARTAFLKAEREARQLALEASWKAQVAAHFGYLEREFGFEYIGVDASHWWGTYVRYRSPLLQVEINRSVESDCVEVELIRLVNGQVPEYPIEFKLDTIVNHRYFFDILHERAPEEHEALKALRGLSDEQLERSLAFQAAALRAYCDDVLRGDLTMFDEATERQHQRTLERLRQKERERAADGGGAQAGDDTPTKPS